MEFDLAFFLVAGPAVVFAGVSKAGFGSGAAFASSSILALILEPGQALGIMLPLLMLVDALSLKPYWKAWDSHQVKLLLIGALPGVIVGAYLYKIANADVLRLLIGGISLMFVFWQIVTSRGWIKLAKRTMPGWFGVLAGLTAGFTSFVSHAGGPPAAVYLLSAGVDKTRFQATTVLVFWVVNIAKAVPYGFLGIFTAQTLLADLYLAPFAFVGTWIGIRAHHLMPERAFFALTYVLLTLTGTKLILDGLL